MSILILTNQQNATFNTQLFKIYELTQEKWKQLSFCAQFNVVHFKGKC